MYIFIAMSYNKDINKRCYPVNGQPHISFSKKFTALVWTLQAVYFFVKSNTRAIKSNRVTFVSFMGTSPFPGLDLTAYRIS